MPLSVEVEGIDSNAGRWCKHYLTPGTDASLDWNGIPDSVSGETYKYSNQFEFGLTAEGLATTYAYYMTLGDVTSASFPYAGVIGQVSYQLFNVLNNMDYFTVWRLPLPDLPAIICFHSTSGYQIGKTVYNFVGMPVFDPNWQPSMVQFGSDKTASNYMPFIHCSKVTQSSSQWPIGVQPHQSLVTKGFSDNLTGYRLAGASMTVVNTASKMYQNGTIVACTADTPLSRPYAYEGNDYPSIPANLSETSTLLSVTDAPLSYDAVSSIKNYHKFTMAEGAYVVLHNLQGEFLFRNPEMDQVPPLYNSNIATSVALTVLNTDSNIMVVCIVLVNGGDQMFIPLVYNGDQHAQYFEHSDDANRVFVPYPFIDPSSLSLWNSAYVSFKSADLDHSLSYTLKFNTYAECYVASNSALKPNVTKSCKFHPGIIDYTSTFYSTHDGIYVAADNDSGNVWKTFKKVLADTADMYFGASPYAPLYNAGKSLIKDLVGGAVKVTQPSAQKFQPKNNNAAKKENKKQAKKQKKEKKTYAQALMSTDKLSKRQQKKMTAKLLADEQRISRLQAAANRLHQNFVDFHLRKAGFEPKSTPKPKPKSGKRRPSQGQERRPSQGQEKQPTSRLKDTPTKGVAYVPTPDGKLQSFQLGIPLQRQQYIDAVRAYRKRVRNAKKAMRRKIKSVAKLSNDL